MSRSGAIIALAYPDVFVRKTDGGYNKILKKVGIVNANLVRAGHAAALIIEPCGKIHYTDFGRYITPEDLGRARTSQTDPDVEIDLKARFTKIGTISNLSEITDYLLERPDLTHGDGRLYAGVFYGVNSEKALQYANKVSYKGSIPYGPFVTNGSNCARFVWSILWKGQRVTGKLRLLNKRLPSPMPLDLVMTAKVYHRHECQLGEVMPFSMSRTNIWWRLFEKPGSEHLLHVDQSIMYNGRGTWLSGVGDGSWFEMTDVDHDTVRILRRNPRGKPIFQHRFERPEGFDHEQEYSFDFDCNALFCHVRQGTNVYRFDSLKENAASDSDSIQTQSRYSFPNLRRT